MSDATRCPKCHWVYWTSYSENWGTCPKCGTNNDLSEEIESPMVVNSGHIFTFLHTKELRELNE